MNLRLKTTITVGIGVIILMLTVYVLLKQHTISTALLLEQTDVTRNLTRAKNAIADELRQLSITTLDWAVFDEAYEYLEGRNPRFAERNLLSNLSILNLEYFIIEKSKTVALAQKRRSGNTYFPTTEAVVDFTNPERWLWRERRQPLQRFDQLEVISGLVARASELYFIAQAAVVPSSSIRASLGNLTMLRKLDLAAVKKISELTQLKIQVIQKIPNSIETLQNSSTIHRLTNGEKNVLYPINSNSIQGYTLLSLNNTYGALVLEVKSGRSAFLSAEDYLQRLAWALLLIGLLITALIVVLLEYGILSRLIMVQLGLRQIANSGDLRHRLQPRGQDELGLLIKQINLVLHQVEETHVKSAQLEARLERLRNLELEANLEATRLELFERLARVAEFRDNETSLHTSRVGEIASAIAIQLGMNPEESERLRFAARLHDIGKIAIPDSILFKPAGLDREEWSLMQTHAALGAQMLEGSGSPLLEMARVIALTHHERWNGSGYPRNLHGEEIPLIGRIVAVADTFDALISPRPYKPAWTLEDALGEIETHSNYLFDPEVVQALLKIRPTLLLQPGRL